MISLVKNRLNSLIRRYLKLNGYIYPDIRRFDKMTRYFHLRDIYGRIENVPGDVVECGVAFGYSLILFGILAKEEGKGRTVYGFDSFEGFPEPAPEDKSIRDTKKGEHSAATLSRVKNIVAQANIDPPILVKGYLEDTLPNFNFKNKIAFLHIDVDLYSGYKTALDVLYDLIPSGGVIAFDEYNEPKWPGATKAVNDFLAKKNLKLEKGKYIDKYFVVKP